METRSDLTENLLGALVLEVADRMAAATSAAAGTGANGPAALVLLLQDGELTIGQLAALLQITHPATVQLVDRLVAGGLVARAVGEDARVRLVTLTGPGRRAAEGVLGERAAVLHDVLAPLTAAQRRTLHATLATLVAGLAGDPASTDHLCRLCDTQICTATVCPAERAVAGSRTGKVR